MQPTWLQLLLAVIGLTLSAWLIRLPDHQLARASHAQR